MNRSLMIMSMMGVIAMVMMTAFGSFFVGKVGGAENVAVLKRDVVGIFGSQMVDPDALAAVVRKDGETFGVELRYAIDPEIAKREKALEYHLRRVSEFVLSREATKGTAEFVVIELVLPDGRVRAERFVRRTSAPTPAVDVKTPVGPG